MGLSFPSYKEVKLHMEEREREARKKIEIEPPTLITSLIVLANAIVFLVTFANAKPQNIYESYGFTPAFLIEFNNMHTLFTHMFIHPDPFHILINMLVFLSFAPQCERRMGKLHFLSFYLLSGVLAAVFYFLFNMSSETPVVGASGAIFGVLAAFVGFFPDKEVYLYIGFTRHKVPAIFGIGLIFLFETVFALISALIRSPIAHLAHVGGFIGGLILLALMYPKPARAFLSILLDALIPYVPESTHENGQSA